MIVYEYTKDCGYETRTANIYINRGHISVSIKTANNIYEYDVNTLEEATELVIKYGFVEIDGTVEVIENDYL